MMSRINEVTPNGMLKTIRDNFDTLAPLINGDSPGLGVLRVARATFDLAIEANRAIGAHGLGVTIPANAIICGGFIEVNTAVTGETNATLAISVKAANDIQTAAAVSGAPWSTTGIKAIVPKANTPESTGIKLAAAKEITATVAAAALTAGKVNVYLYFLEGDATA